jgi:hypothetical protein
MDVVPMISSTRRIKGLGELLTRFRGSINVQSKVVKNRMAHKEALTSITNSNIPKYTSPYLMFNHRRDNPLMSYRNKNK